MQSQPNLNLPPYEVRIEWLEAKQHIWDVIRKQYVVLTPEEWVRQHFIHLLINHLNYPLGLFKVESQLNYHKRRKRSDIQVLDRSGNALLLVECKAPTIPINHTTLKQVSEYNKTLNARYLALSNGLKHHIWGWEEKNQEYQPMTDFPDYLKINS